MSITNKTMTQLQVRGMAFSRSWARLVHIIICLRAPELKHIQIDALVSIVVIKLFLALLCEVLTRYEL